MEKKTNEKRPNILLIQADQLAAQSLPVYGHSLVKAPNIQKIADNGVVFENAYCNFPLCAPSRISMLTGRYAHALGAWDNATEQPASNPTIPHYLRRLGYETILCGKMHFIGPDQLHGYDKRLVTDIYPSNYAWTPDWTKGERDRPTGISMRPVIESGPCARSLQIDYDDEVAYNGRQQIYDLARYGGGKPFFLTVSFTHPHSPFVISEKYWNLYDNAEIDMPTVPELSLDEVDTLSRWLHYAHGADLHTITPQNVRNARHAYYGMVSYVDEKIGEIMSALKESGLEDNTIVILTSDHGEMLGERGMWYKQHFFERSARVPMIVSHPKAFTPKRLQQVVSLVDLLPTILDFAGTKNPVPMVSECDGNSLADLITEGECSDWPDTAISEYSGEGTCAPCRMLRKGDYKYIYTHGNPGLLYNVKLDPLELDNLIDNPDYEETARSMLEILLSDWNPEQINRTILESQKVRMFLKEATNGNPNWAYWAKPGDEKRFVRNDGAAPTKARARFPYVEPVPFER